MPTPQLYCYVDETGTDTKGRLLIVSVVVVTGENREDALRLCEDFEKASGKGKFKWGKARKDLRLDYFRRIVAERRFKGSLRYCIFRNTLNYHQATIEAIARALHWRKPGRYKATVYVDGLTKTMRHTYGRRLRKLAVYTRKVRGVTRDENNALIRLADAVAGLVRDILEGETGEARTLFDHARRHDFLVHV